jgi:outer membrane protein TolC
MKKMNWIILLTLALGTASRGFALDEEPSTNQNPGSLTLEMAQKEALENSPVLRRAQSQEREAGWGQLEAVADGFLPHVTANGQHLFDVQYSAINLQFGSPVLITFPGIYPQTSLTLDASFDLFDGFQNVHQLDAANHRHEAEKINSDWSFFKVREQVRLAFYQALASQKLSDMADENVITLQNHLRLVQNQLENGQATQYDVLRVEVELSEAQSDQMTAHDNVVLAREALAQAMGVPEDERNLTGELPVLDVDSILKKLSESDPMESPQLQAVRFNALAAEDQNDASRASLWVPKVSLVGDYQWYNDPDYLLSGVTPTNDYRTDYYFGASLSWNILDGGLSLAKANEVDEKAKQAKDDYDELKLQTPDDFDLWKRRLISGAAVYQANLTNVEKAGESVRLATAGFKAGTRTTTDVLDAELDEYRASSELVEAQVNALETLIRLELLTGKEISRE